MMVAAETMVRAWTMIQTFITLESVIKNFCYPYFFAIPILLMYDLAFQPFYITLDFELTYDIYFMYAMERSNWASIQFRYIYVSEVGVIAQIHNTLKVMTNRKLPLNDSL